MVGINTSSYVGIQLLIGNARGVAIDDSTFGSGYLAQDLFISANNAGEVHHFTKPDNVRPFEDFFDILGIDFGAACFHVGSWHAGGSHKEHVQGQRLCPVHNKLDTVKPCHVGYLMKVGNQSGSSSGDYGLRILGGMEHRAFYMDMTVYQPRSQIAAF